MRRIRHIMTTQRDTVPNAVERLFGRVHAYVVQLDR